MSSRTLRRLPPLFLLGLLPVVILLWAWADSRGYHTGWTYQRKGDSTKALILVSSALIFQQHERDWSFVPPPGPTPFTISCSFGPVSDLDRMPIGGRLQALGELFPALARTSEVSPVVAGDSRLTVTCRIIPLWLILIAYLPPWLALSWWQARRRYAKIGAALPG